MNCSMALEASEFDRNKVLGSAIRAEGKKIVLAKYLTYEQN